MTAGVRKGAKARNRGVVPRRLAKLDYYATSPALDAKGQTVAYGTLRPIAKAVPRNPPRMIRRATEDDVARIAAIARAAYVKYVSRIGREPPPMIADFAAEIAAGHVVVIEIARAVEGYLISWPKMEVYFIDNIAVDPAILR